MRSGPLAAVTIATLLAISVALATSIGSANDRPAISELTYIGGIDHGQPARLGDCPLSRWITVERDGALLSIWYLQRRQNGLCVPIMDFGDGSSTSDPNAPDVVARSSIRLTSEQMELLQNEISELRWQQQWETIEDMAFPPTLSPGCDHHAPLSDTGSDDDGPHLLVIERADDMVAALTFLGAREARRAGQSCGAAQSDNIALIDAAFAPYVGLMPEAMTLPANLPELLKPETLHLTD